MRVENPIWIEMENERSRDELKKHLLNYMMARRESPFRHPIMCVAILSQESNYPMFKEVFQEFSICSQVVTRRNAEKFNLSKATNILKQINSKIGGDLFYMKFPKTMENMRTMLIGIDVCHAGPQSIVGFAASTNKEMSQYYSEYLVQKKGQEIVGNGMKDGLKYAIDVFKRENKDMPTDFIIYRDGVGDAQRQQILAKEVSQFKQAITELYDSEQPQPKITLVVVNKRIN